MANPFLRRAYAGYVVARSLSALSSGRTMAAPGVRKRTAPHPSPPQAVATTAPSAEAALPPLPTKRLFGVDVAAITFDEAIARIIAWSKTVPARTVITTNLDHVLKLRSDKRFRRCYDEADMITADGMPFVWLAKHEGQPLKERVTGSDLIEPLMEAAARHGRSVFLRFDDGTPSRRGQGSQDALPAAGVPRRLRAPLRLRT